MARSIRILYRGVKGRVRNNFNWPPIHKNSAVIITACEYSPDDTPTFVEGGRPNLGDATIFVTNVGPHNPEGGDGGVEFYLHVDWPDPLNVAVTISVLEDIETFHQA